MINIAKKILVKKKTKCFMTMPGEIIVFLINVNVHITFGSMFLKKIMKYNKTLCIGV